MNSTSRTQCSTRLILLAAAWLGLILVGCGPVYVDDGYGYRAPPPAHATPAPVAAAVSNDMRASFPDLAAHGRWINTAQWGQVWVPTANSKAWWRPYYLGHWVWTEYGWTWSSEESWGWGPYHYGRWAWHDSHRWVWIPGTTWGPAWVVWRSGGGCAGWAPMGPGGHVWAHHSYWVFVPHSQITVNRVYRVVIPPARVTTVYNQSHPVGTDVRVRDKHGKTVVYNSGPSREVVQQWTRTKVPARSANSVPGAVPRRRPGGEVGSPHPHVTRGPPAGTRPQPGSRGVDGRGASMPVPRGDARPTAPPASRPSTPAPPLRGAVPAPTSGPRRWQPGSAAPPPSGYRPPTRQTPPTYRPPSPPPVRPKTSRPGTSRPPAAPPRPYYGARPPVPPKAHRPGKRPPARGAQPKPPPKRNKREVPKSVKRPRETPKWVREPERHPGRRGR